VKELSVPSDEDVQERKAERILVRLVEAARALPLDDFLDLGPVARRITAHEQSDRIVALLLKGHLAAPAGEGDDEPDEAGAPPTGGWREGRRDEGRGGRRGGRGRGGGQRR
jgi:hypothetical protein